MACLSAKRLLITLNIAITRSASSLRGVLQCFVAVTRWMCGCSKVALNEQISDEVWRAVLWLLTLLPSSAIVNVGILCSASHDQPISLNGNITVHVAKNIKLPYV